MSSSVSVTFSLELHARRWQTALAVAAVCVCALVPWGLRDLPASAQLVGSLIGAIATYAGAVRAGWLSARRGIVRFGRLGADDWWLQDGAGRAVHTRLHAGTRCFRRFICLQFDSRQRLLLGPGDLATQEFRRLRVLLRQQHPQSRPERVA